MADVWNPLIDRARGKLGNVVFSTWKNLKVLRVRVIPHNPKTPKQTAHRNAFKLTIETMRRRLDILEIGFEPYQKLGKTALNGGTRYNYGQASLGAITANPIAPYVPIVDTTKFVFSNGPIDNILSPIITNNTIAAFQVSWTDNTNGTTALATDMAILVLLNTTPTVNVLQRYYDSIAINQGDVRSAGVMTHALPAIWSGRTVAVYIFMWRNIVPRVSDVMPSQTLYIGTTSIP